jgi:hypothetical protein
MQLKKAFQQMQNTNVSCNFDDQKRSLIILILGCLPFTFPCAPFMLDGLKSPLGWSEIGLIVLYLILIAILARPVLPAIPNWLTVILRLLLLALLGAYIAGIVYSVRNFIAARTPPTTPGDGEIQPYPDDEEANIPPQ